MRISILALLFAAVFVSSEFAQSKSNIEGVWSHTEASMSGPNAFKTPMSQPSIYIFAKKHYSIIYVNGDAPRPIIADVSKATAEELRNVYVDNFIANAGTYELKGGKLTLRPTVAKGPGYMQPNIYTNLSVKINGRTMTMVRDGSNDGPMPYPLTYKLKRIE